MKFYVTFLSVLLVASLTFAPVTQANSLGRRHISRNVVNRPVTKSSTYPRVRQLDGKSLWDLGMQKGQWPKLP
jgi:hypothetical protein